MKTRQQSAALSMTTPTARRPIPEHSAVRGPPPIERDDKSETPKARRCLMNDLLLITPPQNNSNSEENNSSDEDCDIQTPLRSLKRPLPPCPDAPKVDRRAKVPRPRGKSNQPRRLCFC